VNAVPPITGLTCFGMIELNNQVSGFLFHLLLTVQNGGLLLGCLLGFHERAGCTTRCICACPHRPQISLNGFVWIAGRVDLTSRMASDGDPPSTGFPPAHGVHPCPTDGASKRRRRTICRIRFVLGLERSGRAFDRFHYARNAMQLLLLKGRHGSTFCRPLTD
jgi:hypothetical protein